MLFFERNDPIKCCIVISNNEVSDFLWARYPCKILSKERNFDVKNQLLICIKAIGYFAEYHRKNFFHGDIKPDNIFVLNTFEEITSDSGTLLDVGSD
jgi:serine/threonine protein kinase